MTGDKLNAALQAEYLQLQKTIEDFDGRMLTIKAWSVTFSMATLVAAFAVGSRSGFLFSSVSALIFWYIEARWKTFQCAYYARNEEIEKHFQGKEQIKYPFQIGSSWFESFGKEHKTKLKQVMFWSNVALPHKYIVVLGLVIFFVSLFTCMKP